MSTRSERWASLWQRVGATGPGAAVLEELERQYAEPGRHYHTLTHLDSTLDRFDDLRHLADHPDSVELALWVHDVIWEPLAHDCEARSAAWARARLEPAGVSEGIVAQVTRLVMATTHPTTPPSDHDDAVTRDADLAILAAPEEEFDRYDQAVRREYQMVPDADYRRGRASVLRGFLERPALFFTAPMRLLEPRARANMARALRRLDIPS